MAETTGLVHRLSISEDRWACIWIGANPTITELLLLGKDDDSPSVSAFKSSILDALTTAMVYRREVVAFHGDDDSYITNLRIEPI